MIKRTLYFGNPAYLSLKNNQLVIHKPDEETEYDKLTGGDTLVKTVPIEDVGLVVLDHKRITITSGVISSMLDNNVALITCGNTSMPEGLLLPLSSNSVQSERFSHQIGASLPLKKQLWQQTVIAKIINQAGMIKYTNGVEAKNMKAWSNDVKSGDAENMEGRAAAYYWRNVFPAVNNFVRGQNEAPPNNMLNYGYAILRAIVARAIVSSGMLPTLGIHHHNRYNAYCLADDIMEPYRPYVDKLVYDFCFKNNNWTPDLDISAKGALLQLPVVDVFINGERSPLMIAATTTTSSLYKCFRGDSRKILYPIFNVTL